MKKGATQNSTYFVPNLFRECSVKLAILGNARNARNVDLTMFCNFRKRQEIIKNAT